MKTLLKLSVFLLIIFVPGFLAAQDYPSPQPDEGMDIFLLVTGCLLVSAMIGAAIVGAFLAAFVIFLVFFLAAIGILSASVAVGIYNRSFSAGFQSLFLLFFGLTTAVLDAGGLLLFNALVPLHITNSYLIIIGLAGGFMGGLLLGRFLYGIGKELVAVLAKRLKLI